MHVKSALDTTRRFWLWPTILSIGMVVLFLIPGGFVDKSRLLLHGLCAQTPDHTFRLGGQPLPFDARMTGIYSGTFITLVYLAVRRRLLSQALPSGKSIALLAGFVLIMAADGFNSLFTDIGLWHPWQSANMLRLATGYGMGVALAVALVWLVAGTVFQVSSRTPAISSWRDLIWCIAPLVMIGVVVDQGWARFYIPLSMILMSSAWIVMGTLAFVTLLLISRFDERIVRTGQLHIPGAIGLLLGLAIMVLLAFGRSWLEQTMGITSTL